jgi:hypothetical protein
LNQPRYAYLREIDRFVGVLVSTLRTRAQPFFFWAGLLEAGEEVKVSKIEEHLPSWRTRLEAGPTTRVDDATRLWQCGLVATHIFRPQRRNLAWMPLEVDAAGWLQAVRLLGSPVEPGQ